MNTDANGYTTYTMDDLVSMMKDKKYKAMVEKARKFLSDNKQPTKKAEEWFKNTILDRTIPGFVRIYVFSTLTSTDYLCLHPKRKESFVRMWRSIESEVVSLAKDENNDNSCVLFMPLSEEKVAALGCSAFLRNRK